MPPHGVNNLSSRRTIKNRSCWLALWTGSLLSTLSVGCRAFPSHRPDRKVVQARQLSLQGVDLLSREQLRGAEDCFDRAIKQCPTDERAHWGYGQTLWATGKHAEAIGHMQEAVRLSGENPDYIVRLGQMYIAMGQNDEAKTLADQILERHRDNPTAWELKGDTLVQTRQWDDALNAYHRSLLLQPDNPPVQLAVAQIYHQTSRPHRSLATLDRMLDQRPGSQIDGRLQLAKGLALADLGRRTEANNALALAAQRLSPSDASNQIQLAQAQHQIGQLDDAKITLAKVLVDHPHDAAALRLQGMLDLSYQHLAATPLADAGLLQR